MSLRVRPRPVQDGAARTCKSVAYGNMAQTRARGLNTHVEAGVLMQAKRQYDARAIETTPATALLAAPPSTQSQLRIIDRSTPAAASLPCDSSSTNDLRQYLSDCMGGQQHARGAGGGAMRRDARPPPRASDGCGASALTPWLFPHEKANSR